MKLDRKAIIEETVIASGRLGAYNTVLAGLMRYEQGGKEQQRIAAVTKPAAVPANASAEIIAAPARGPVKVVPQSETVTTPNGPRQTNATIDGFHPVIAQDAFDKMATASANRRAGGDAPFTVRQVEAGREYASLHERCASEGLRCSSPEARQGGNGSDVDWIQGVIDRSRRLDAIHAAIGSGLALAPRNERAHADRGKRSAVRVRDLVDAVCIQGRTLSEVLTLKGWPVGGKYRADLRKVLCVALDRMYGL